MLDYYLQQWNKIILDTDFISTVDILLLNQLPLNQLKVGIFYITVTVFLTESSEICFKTLEKKLYVECIWKVRKFEPEFKFYDSGLLALHLHSVNPNNIVYLKIMNTFLYLVLMIPHLSYL